MGPCHALYSCCQVLWSPACTVHVVTVTVVAATSQGDDEIDSTRIMFTYWFSTSRNPTPPRSEMADARSSKNLNRIRLRVSLIFLFV